jgi:uncharacterized protein (TIGR00296 family)
MAQGQSAATGGFTATREMCFLCFEALVNHLTGEATRVVQQYLEREGLASHRFPLFVTWTKSGSLRGCIGTFSAHSLIKGLQEYAVTAGVRDRRFSPIQRAEVEQLACEVSLLHSFERCRDPLDWEVGLHGTTFTMGGHTATFLPEVASEQRWNKQQTLDQLARKSGMRRQITQADYPQIELERYQSSHITVTWAEYQDFLKTFQ